VVGGKSPAEAGAPAGSCHADAVEHLPIIEAGIEIDQPFDAGGKSGCQDTELTPGERMPANEAFASPSESSTATMSWTSVVVS